MNRKWILTSLLLLLVLGVTAAAAQDATETPSMQQAGATAMLQDVNGNTVGQVTFSQRDDGKVVILAQVNSLTPGFHGFHIHSVGQCDPSGDTPFASAGGHFDPANADHPAHAGDLPVILVNADGTGDLMTVTDRFQLSDLFDGDGSAVVIHAGADNFANIPSRYAAQPDSDTLKSGDSGAREACGVIQQDSEATAG